MNNYQLLFSHWFVANYDNLRMQLCCDKKFGELYAPNCEDDFHNAYLCVIDSLKRFDGNADFSTLFYAAYRRQRKAYKAHEMKEIRPNDLFWGVLTANIIDDDENTNNDKSQLIASIRQFAKRTFNNDDFALFEAYFIHSFGLKNSGEFCGKSTTWAFLHVANIREMICKQFDDELNNLK